MAQDETTTTEPALKHETYVCSCADGNIEWGYCFKKPGEEDVQFDLVIDKASPDIATAQRLEADWARLAWAAEAITLASAKHAYSLLK